MADKAYFNQQTATEYLSERLPYPVMPQDICRWYRENRLRGETKGEGSRVYYMKSALDGFIAEDELRRTQEHMQRKANMQAETQGKTTRRVWQNQSHATVEDIKAAARAAKAKGR